MGKKWFIKRDWASWEVYSRIKEENGGEYKKKWYYRFIKYVNSR